MHNRNKGRVPKCGRASWDEFSGQMHDLLLLNSQDDFPGEFQNNIGYCYGTFQRRLEELNPTMETLASEQMMKPDGDVELSPEEVENFR